MAVTMQEIARASGVSQPTVSFVVNGRDRELKISSATRERVLETARRLGYRRNSAAKAVATGKFGTISLLQSTQPNTSYLPAGLLDGIHDALLKVGVLLMYGRLPQARLEDVHFVPKILQEWSSDGLLIDYINDIPQTLIDLVERYSVPAVWINSRHAVNCVFPDDYNGSLDATKKLIALGHRQITYVIYIKNYTTKHKHFSEIDRLAGYTRAMLDAGLIPHVVGSGLSIPILEADAFTRSWLDSSQRPTAVLVYGVQTAISVFMVARSLGLSVPGDLSLVCFDANDTSDILGVPFSAMRIPQAEVGRQAVAQLLRRIAAPKQSLDPIMVPLIWKEGKTMGPPNRASGIGLKH